MTSHLLSPSSHLKMTLNLPIFHTAQPFPVSSLRLGYVLIHTTPPYNTRLEARKQGLAFISVT